MNRKAAERCQKLESEVAASDMKMDAMKSLNTVMDDRNNENKKLKDQILDLDAQLRKTN